MSIEVSSDWPQGSVLEFVASRIGAQAADMMPATTAAVLRNGEMIAGVVFNNYHVLDHGSWCEISVAADDRRWLTRGVLRGIFAYPFCQIRATRLQAVCSTDNSRMLSILKRVGFTQEGVLRRAYDGVNDVVVWSMLPDECRWV